MQYMVKNPVETIMRDIIIKTEIFREGDQYVAISPELNVSSFGDSPKEAKASLIKAISLFLEECERMGTLNKVIEEAGFNYIVTTKTK